MSENEFIEKSKKVHGDKYNYDLVDYKGSQIKVKIICPIHGEFEQSPNSHLVGKGCSNCGDIYKGGWTKSQWLIKAKNSKKFDSFKVYVIKCYNNTEEFIKIGRTFKSVNNRFSGKIPYNYEIISTFIYDEYEKVFELENKLKEILSNNSYLPNISFSGMYECYVNSEIVIKKINSFHQMFNKTN